MANVPLIHNPASGAGRAAARADQALRALDSRGVSAQLVATSGPGDARALARRLAQDGAPRVLALGGDGTASEVVDGVIASGRACDVGFLPGGTGNDFLLAFGVRTIEEAAERIASGAARPLDAFHLRSGSASRNGIGVFGVGFAAHVADRANRSLKRFGASAYTLAVFPEVMRLQAPQTRLELDGVVVDEPLALVAACNTRYTGGGMDIAPMAQPDDGALDIIALRRTGRAKLALRMLPLLLRGKHVGHPDVIHARARHVRIEPAQPSLLLADGEIFGETPVEIDVAPRAWQALL